MTFRTPILLTKHRLNHLKLLRVSDDFFTRRFAAGCSMVHCNASCCQHGVMVGLQERDRILAHASMVQRYMEPHQDKNPERWFESEEEADRDFAEGRAIGTQVRQYGCVFLDSAGQCVLQRAAMGEGMDKFALKPFFCVAFPITIEDDVLMVDDPSFTERKQCCSTSDDGPLDVLDVYKEEQEFILGPTGFEELCNARKTALAPPKSSNE